MNFKPLTVYFAHYESRNFTFEAFGLTPNEAKGALLIGLEKHAKQYADRLEDEHWWYDEDIWIEGRQVGVCYRDRDTINYKGN
jgi:hypothetical protein